MESTLYFLMVIGFLAGLMDAAVGGGAASGEWIWLPAAASVEYLSVMPSSMAQCHLHSVFCTVFISTAQRCCVRHNAFGWLLMA